MSSLRMATSLALSRSSRNADCSVHGEQVGLWPYQPGAPPIAWPTKGLLLTRSGVGGGAVGCWEVGSRPPALSLSVFVVSPIFFQFPAAVTVFPDNTVLTS